MAVTPVVSNPHASRSPGNPAGVLSRMPDALITTHLFPFMDLPPLPEERSGDATLRTYARRWFSYGNLPLINRRFRDLVAGDRQGGGEGDRRAGFRGIGRILVNYIEQMEAQIPQHILNGCHHISLRIFFSARPGALSIPGSGSMLHLALAPRRPQEGFSLSFVAHLCALSRRHHLGLLEREDEQHQRPLDRLCTSGLTYDAMRSALPLLLEGGRSVDQANSQGRTALHHVAAQSITPRSLSGLRLLLERGADPNLLNPQGKNALEIYVENIFSRVMAAEEVEGWAEGVDCLLTHGARVPFSLLQYREPGWNLHELAGGWREYQIGEGMVRIFQKHPALRASPPSWLLRDGNGNTYLHRLLHRGTSSYTLKEYCKWMEEHHLVELQKQILAKNHRGQTPLDLARLAEQIHPGRVQVLEQYAPVDVCQELAQCKRKGFYHDVRGLLPHPDYIGTLLEHLLSEPNLKVSLTALGTPYISLRSPKGDLFCFKLDALARLCVNTIEYSLIPALRRKYVLSKLHELYRQGELQLKCSNLFTRAFVAIRKCVSSVLFFLLRLVYCLVGSVRGYRRAPGPIRNRIKEEFALPLEIPTGVRRKDSFLRKYPPDKTDPEAKSCFYSSKRVIAIFDGLAKQSREVLRSAKAQA